MNIKICDICEGRKNLNTRWYFTDTKMGASGSMENERETFDLCESCELKIFRSLTAKGLKSNDKVVISNLSMINAIETATQRKK